MEEYAAEMNVEKVTFDVWKYSTGVCEAISTGLGRNKVLEQVTFFCIPEDKKQFVKSKLSAIKTVTVHVHIE